MQYTASVPLIRFHMSPSMSNIWFHFRLCLTRITPFLPNWFINIVSPVIGVDLRPFWIGTFVGVAPPSFVAIQVGKNCVQKFKKKKEIFQLTPSCPRIHTGWNYPSAIDFGHRGTDLRFCRVTCCLCPAKHSASFVSRKVSGFITAHIPDRANSSMN